ncbi:MAG: ribonuclease Y [Clostridiales bacterium]|nr:ribonuclease Y [Clostridiales bacterium]
MLQFNLDLIDIIIICVALVVVLVLSVCIGYSYRKKVAERKIMSAEESANKIVEEGRKQAEAIKKEKLLEAKEENHRLRSEIDKEIKDRRNEINKLEQRLQNKDENLDRKQQSLEVREENLKKSIQSLDVRAKEIDVLIEKQNAELERVSGLSQAQAREMLLESLEKDIVHESAQKIRESEALVKEECSKKARWIISCALQKAAVDFVSESTSSVVELPNDEMKGRIIGREGRNIRALEAATGIDLIVDDTPEAVILSGFDPVRREVARLAIEKLVVDGRIHPARIEEMVEKARREMDTKIKDLGEQAVFEVGVHGIHPELVKLIGRLNYRTSYGQNILKHSLEVAFLSATIAAEIGADVRIAKRAGLLHDIGKAIDHEVEGPHVQIGADVAKKYKENNNIIHAILAHHGDVEATTVEAVIVQAADAISASRPGARRESVEAYVKRLQQLEEISDSFEGVEKSFAIQAGREVRIIVKPEKITDDQMLVLARNIANKIESELDYPGQIKVNVIRENRACEYAK